MTTPAWRTSSFSSTGSTCVEVARTEDRILVRNSVHPGAGTLAVAPALAATWLASVHDGHWDDLAG